MPLDAREIMPPHTGAAELALVQSVIGAAETPVPLRDLWRADVAPTNVLPWLAWALSVDEWGRDWPEATKRAAIAASIEIHRHKGTLYSIRLALRAAGYGEALILEKFSNNAYDGSFTHDGSQNHTPSDHWADYRVIMDRPMTIEQAARLRAILMMTAPARCRLRLLDFVAVAHIYNAALIYDGTNSYGGA